MELRNVCSVHKKHCRTPLRKMCFLQQLSDENYCCPVFPWGRIPRRGRSRCQTPTKRWETRQTWRSPSICCYGGIRTFFGRWVVTAAEKTIIGNVTGRRRRRTHYTTPGGVWAGSFTYGERGQLERSHRTRGHLKREFENRRESVAVRTRANCAKIRRRWFTHSKQANTKQKVRVSAEAASGEPIVFGTAVLTNESWSIYATGNGRVSRRTFDRFGGGTSWPRRGRRTGRVGPVRCGCVRRRTPRARPLITCAATAVITADRAVQYDTNVNRTRAERRVTATEIQYRLHNTPSGAVCWRRKTKRPPAARACCNSSYIVKKKKKQNLENGRSTLEIENSTVDHHRHTYTKTVYGIWSHMISAVGKYCWAQNRFFLWGPDSSGFVGNHPPPSWRLRPINS